MVRLFSEVELTLSAGERPFEVVARLRRTGDAGGASAGRGVSLPTRRAGAELVAAGKDEEKEED